MHKSIFDSFFKYPFIIPYFYGLIEENLLFKMRLGKKKKV